MPIIRVGVQAPQGSPGQIVDTDGPVAGISSIANVSAEQIAYSMDGGASWAPLSAGQSVSGGTVTAGMLRMRKVASTGAYPANVDVNMTVYGLSDAEFAEPWMAASLFALIGAHPTRIFHDDEPLLIDDEPIFHTPD